MNSFLRYRRELVVVHFAATMFMVGLIWTIHTVHYPLFAQVGESTYVAFQSEHVDRIGKLLLFPWLLEGVSLIGVLALSLQAGYKKVRLSSLINGAAMAVVLIISGFWSAPAHGELADGFDPEVHDRLLNANFIRTLAWTICGICAIWTLLTVWKSDQQDTPEITA